MLVVRVCIFMMNCDEIMGWGVSSVNEHEGIKIEHDLCMNDTVVMKYHVDLFLRFSYWR